MSEVREKWLKALRSGKYRQTQKKLRGPDGFCCLGVFCEVMGYVYEGLFEYTDHDGTTLEASLDEPQLRLLFPEISSHERDRLHDDLITLNDDGHSFEEIADYVDWVFDPEHLERRGWLARQEMVAPILQWLEIRRSR